MGRGCIFLPVTGKYIEKAMVKKIYLLHVPIFFFENMSTQRKVRQSPAVSTVCVVTVGNEETERPGLEVVKDPEGEKDPNAKQTYAEVVKKVTWKEETAAMQTTAVAETQLLSLSI